MFSFDELSGSEITDTLRLLDSRLEIRHRAAIRLLTWTGLHELMSLSNLDSEDSSITSQEYCPTEAIFENLRPVALAV